MYIKIFFCDWNPFPSSVSSFLIIPRYNDILSINLTNCSNIRMLHLLLPILKLLFITQHHSLSPLRSQIIFPLKELCWSLENTTHQQFPSIILPVSFIYAICHCLELRCVYLSTLTVYFLLWHQLQRETREHLFIVNNCPLSV